MVQFDCPWHLKSSVSSSFGVEKLPISQNWPSGVIRIGLPVWKWKTCKNMETKVAYWGANCPVWMPQALETLCLIQFWSWKNSLFPLLALWGNKNWPPSMKVKKLQKYQNKSGLKWTANGPVWIPKAPKTFCLILFLSWMNPPFAINNPLG